jgi:hypothetical protein
MMSNNSRRLGIAAAAALVLAGVASIAFAIGVASNGPSNTVLADQGTIPGHPELGPGWQSPGGGRYAEGGVTIAITAISGSKLSLQTTDGWTRTIDATGATITKAGQTIAVSDLQVGDQITFRESLQSDGTYKITSITVLVPTTSGTVTSIGASSITVSQPGGGTRTIAVTGSTTYMQAGATVSKSAVAVGDRIVAQGAVDSSGNFMATSITIQPATVQGTVQSKTSSTIVVSANGTTVTVNVNASTRYIVRGQSSPTLADIAVGDRIVAQGTHNADGSITATLVQAGTNDQPAYPIGPGGRGFGGFGGGFRGNGGWPGAGATPGASAPSA